MRELCEGALFEKPGWGWGDLGGRTECLYFQRKTNHFGAEGTPQAPPWEARSFVNRFVKPCEGFVNAIGAHWPIGRPGDL